MNRYTVRYAHLKHEPLYVKGDKIKRGQCVGQMGSTGQSTKAHLHIDVVGGWYNELYHLSDITSHKYVPCPIQLNYFIDAELFECEPIITTWYYDYRYPAKFGKQHPGYDIVPKDKEKTYIYWNRSMTGEVLAVGVDNGYGNYIMIGYDKGAS